MLVTCFLAIVIPHVDLFIALIGAFACTALALIFPPIAYLLVNFQQNRWKKVDTIQLIWLLVRPCKMSHFHNPLLSLQMFRPTRWEKAFCYFILAFGMIGAVSGTFFASKDIVCALSGLPVGGSFPCKEP